MADMTSRLWAVLPKRWFAEQSPNLGALLRCIATPWAWLYNLIGYVISQTRLATATDVWLDLIALDYFGSILSRGEGETDAAFRTRIQAALLREAATRSAVRAGLEALIGSQPIVFEPANCMDTGCYGSSSGPLAAASTGMAYGQAGGWGNLKLPLQFFVTAKRPMTSSLGILAGYCTPIGGYGEGQIAYADLSLLPGHVTDANIEATLSSLLPVNAVAWLRLI